MLNKKRINFSKIKKGKSFLSKLFDILNDSSYNEIIHWNSEGTSIIISEPKKLCDVVLPNYYTHSNYSTFIRQLNIYGFRKIKNKVEEFKNEKFCKNITKDDIKQIMRKSKKMKLLLKYNDAKEKNILSDSSGNDIIYSLLNRNEESFQNYFKLRQQFEELKFYNKSLKEQLCRVKSDFNGQSIILSKIINNAKTTKNINRQKNIKSHNIKELFKHYLYNLRIYSPYLI